MFRPVFASWYISEKGNWETLMVGTLQFPINNEIIFSATASTCLIHSATIR